MAKAVAKKTAKTDAVAPISAAQKITRAMELLLGGATRPFILEAAMAEGWGGKTQDVDKAIERAEQEIATLIQEERDVVFGMATARLHFLYARALKIQDFKTALSIQKEINRLYGL